MYAYNPKNNAGGTESSKIKTKALYRSNPCGSSTIKPAKRENCREKNKRKIKYGLYG
jgi:hypothetical protein